MSMKEKNETVPVNSDLSVEMTFVIKSYNIDAGGHVNNAVYINWLEDLRTKMLEKIILNEFLVENNMHFVVASTNIEYKKPLHLYQKPVGKLKLDKYRKGVWYFSCLISLNEKVIAKAFQKCVMINKSTQKMISENVFKLQE